VLRTVSIVGFLCMGCSSDQGIGLLDKGIRGGDDEVAEAEGDPVEPEEVEDPWAVAPGPVHLPDGPSNNETPDPDPEDEADPASIQMWIEAVFQRNRWGDGLGRCQVQVAFRRLAPPSDDIPEEPATDPGLPQIELPEESGDCLYTNLVPTDPIDPDDVIHDEPPPDDVAGLDDWFVSGDMAAGEEIYLHSWDTTLVLTRQTLDRGELRYELEGCDESVFPFNQVFDLEVPFLEDAEIPGFYVDDAIAVGHDVWVTDPIPSLSAEVYFHPDGEAISFGWEHLGATPVVDEEILMPQRMIFARNHYEGEFIPFEALACLPAGTEMSLLAEDVTQLAMNPDEETEEYYVALQIDTVYESPAFTAPWGQTVMSKSTVSQSGEVHLYEVD